VTPEDKKAALLRDMAAPGGVAIVCMEMQNGVVGPASPLPALADGVRARNVVPNLGALMAAARRAGVPVVFCNVAYRSDGMGRATNAPMFAATRTIPGHMTIGTPATDVIAGLGYSEGDFVISRSHGMSPLNSNVGKKPSI
jgi:nicotinamidase-related amidase